MQPHTLVRHTLLALIGWLALALAGTARADHGRIYLPLVQRAPQVEPIIFASQLGADGAPLDAGYSFAYGISRIYAIVDVGGAEGFFWRVEWDFPGGTTALDCRRDNPDNQCPITNSAIRFTPLLHYPSGQPLAQGVYRLRFYLNDVLYQAGIAEIR
ncbi:hypothetical protein [Kallotenue papyrolyticum]|uniref:hypothetical protein n=1 Tax=Kallotenue papyrolyticum TaxID=1325125 RepID=UPI0004786275|nr:hypothetical protein [Kallotenue papyrolyticum]